MLFIGDGQGKGYQAGVNKDHQLLTLSTAISYEHYICHEYGEAYTAIANVTPTGPGDCIFYLKNTADIDLVLTNMYFAANSLELFDIRLGSVTGTPSGTLYTPVNRNAGAGNVATVVCAVGVNITNITTGDLLDKVKVVGNESSRGFGWETTTVLPKNDSVALYANSGTIPVLVSVAFYMHKL